MSEVQSLTLEPEAATGREEDSEDQQLEAEEAAKKNKFWENDSLTPFVGAQAGELLRAPWMGGAVTTLAEAMLNYSLPIAEAEQYSFIAMLEGLLISYKLELEQEQNQKELEADQLDTDKAEETEKGVDAKTADRPQNNKAEAKTQKEILGQKSPSKNNEQKISTDKLAVSKLDKSAKAKTKAEPTLTENLAASIDNLAVDVPKIKNNQTPKIQEALTQATGGITASEAKPETDQSRPEEPEIIKKTSAGELAEIILDLSGELPQQERFENSLETIKDTELIYSREDFEEEATAQFEFDETEDIVSEPLEVDFATIFLERIEENQNPEQNDLTNLTIEEIEQPLVQLTEAIETSSPEVIEELNQILDKIIEASQKSEMDGGVNTSVEAEVQKELEELFIKLFDWMDINYTHEQIESLAYLTIHWGLVDELAILKAKEKLADKPQDRGTHEIIRKILVAISTIKKALLNAGSIGKSALRLYNISNAKYLTSQVF